MMNTTRCWVSNNEGCNSILHNQKLLRIKSSDTILKKKKKNNSSLLFLITYIKYIIIKILLFLILIKQNKTVILKL